MNQEKEKCTHKKGGYEFARDRAGKNMTCVCIECDGTFIASIPQNQQQDWEKEPQWNHVIVAHDFETGRPRIFNFLTDGDQYLLVKEDGDFIATTRLQAVMEYKERVRGALEQEISRSKKDYPTDTERGQNATAMRGVVVGEIEAYGKAVSLLDQESNLTI